MTDPSTQRVAIVTGVSRRSGIGFAVARRLRADGYRVLVHSWSEADAEQGLSDPGGTTAVLADLGGEGPALAHVEADLAEPAAAAAVVDAALGAFGAVDALVVNHATPLRSPTFALLRPQRFTHPDRDDRTAVCRRATGR